MDRTKSALSLVGIGAIVGAFVTLFAVYGLGARLNKLTIGPVEFDIPTPTPISTTPQTVEIRGEVWSVSISEAFQYKKRILTSDRFVNFVAEVDVRIDDDSPEFHGLLFRYQNEDFYSFRITSKGDFAFDVWESGDTQTLLGPATTSSIHKGLGKTNRLKVVARGNEFDLFINGTKVGSVIDHANTFQTGAVGCISCTCDGSTSSSATFSNFFVYPSD